MSTIQLNHIKKKLETDYCPQIDMTDYAGKPTDETAAARLSRALAAFAIAERLGVDAAVAAESITDGFDDNGVDAIGIDFDKGVVVVVQSKWDSTGGGSPQLGDVQKFIQGYRDLTEPRFDRFNDKVRRKAGDLTTALDNADMRFEILLVHTGNQPLSTHAESAFADLLAQANDVLDTSLTLQVLGQAELHAYVRRAAASRAPDITVTMYDWGMTDDPYKAIYGQVDAVDVVEWWTDHRLTLFDANLRKFIFDSTVNESIVQTLLDEPRNFWYFNNGITALCDRISKAPLGGTRRRSGKFSFAGTRIVNGAQTVGSIGTAAQRKPDCIEDARVHVRFISLEDCPDGFSTAVTRATNTQNSVLPRDFVALDSEQERLRGDLLLDLGKVYAIKRGEQDPARDEGCTVIEATAALACAHSLDLAVQAKREFGRLWEDVHKAPYTDIFNGRVRSTRLWRAVEVLRLVEETLKERQGATEGRERQVAVHANRLVANLVFESLPSGMLDDPSKDFQVWLDQTPTLTRAALSAVWTVMSSDFTNVYPAPTFKSASRCRDIASLVKARLADGPPS